MSGGESLSDRFLAEVYRPREKLAQLEANLARIADASAVLSKKGVRVRCLQTVILSEEETCLHLFAAASPDAVEQALRMAGLEAERISLVFESETEHPCG